MEIITGDPYTIRITKEADGPRDENTASLAWHVEIDDSLYIVSGNARKWFVISNETDLEGLEVGSKKWLERIWHPTHKKHGPFHSKMEACVYIGQHYAHKRQEDMLAEQIKNFEPK